LNEAAEPTKIISHPHNLQFLRNDFRERKNSVRLFGFLEEASINPMSVSRVTVNSPVSFIYIIEQLDIVVAAPFHTVLIGVSHLKLDQYLIN